MDGNSLENFLQQTQTRVDKALEKVLPSENQIPQRLHQAMRYSVLNGGKRLRPALVYATGALFHADPAILDHTACAVELIHAYSLVHDDLPSMDNDVLRRGKPTCHINFDEATAILAGDALQSLAFECIAHTNLTLVNILAKAAGSLGMAGGQAIDIGNTGNTLDIHALKQMHQYKTGALITAAVNMGAHANTNASAEQLKRLHTYAECLGLAFQVQDDILDVEASTEALGKTAGKDAQHHKPTFTSLLGLIPAKHYTQELYAQALEALTMFDRTADPLRALAAFAVERDH
jgi:geranylgeranyl pyrophosphate synthase